jgi:hypothetical protein
VHDQYLHTVIKNLQAEIVSQQQRENEKEAERIDQQVWPHEAFKWNCPWMAVRLT